MTPPPLPPEVRAKLRQRPPAVRRRAEQVWQLLEGADAVPEGLPDVEAAWQALEGRLEAAPHLSRAGDRHPRRPRRRRAGPAWAGGVLVGALLAAGLFAWTRPAVVDAPPGRRQTVELPDGSRVHLNGGSRLSYRRHFAAWPGVPAAVRRVVLHGEAFFAVQPAARPFVVETFNARVEVLGTRFNVRARPYGGGATEVTLEEGRVRVTPRTEAGAGVVLAEAGQAARVAPGEAAPDVRQARLDHVLAWRRNGFTVVDQPVSVILKELEQAFGVSVEVAERLVLSDSMTLIYQQGARPASVIHDLCLEQGWHYRRTSRGFAIF